MDDIRDAIVAALGDVHDPCCRELGISVVDMGLVEEVAVDGDHARVELVLTSGWCPFVAGLLESVRERVVAVEGVGDATVEVTWDRVWTPQRLSPGARGKLQFLPPPVAVADRDRYVANHGTTGGQRDDR